VGQLTARRLRQPAGGAVRRRPRRGPVPTASPHSEAVSPHRLAPQWAVENPEHVWTGDRTYGGTAEGGLDGAILLDVEARNVVGGAMRSHIASTLGQ
jgi:hypothetical protein